jgi:hypothetical protein
VIEDRTLGVLLAFVAEVTVPFFFIGLVVARTIASFPDRIGSLYCADLVGSAAGCGLAVLLLSGGVSAVQAILWGAALVALGGLCFAVRRSAGGAALAVLLLAALGWLLARGDAEAVFALRAPESKPLHKVTNLGEYLPGIAAERALDGALLPVRNPPWDRGIAQLTDGTKLEVETGYAETPDGTAFRVFTDDGPMDLPKARIAKRPDGAFDFTLVPWITHTEWSTLARVDAFHWPRPMGPWGLWGLSPRFAEEVREPFPAQKGITIDFWAMTSILRYSGKPLWPEAEAAEARRPLRVLEYLPAGTVHRLLPEAGSVLCIGAGGGLDLLTAKYFGAKRITGVEINGSVVAATRDVFPGFAGHLYDPERHPDVRVAVAEGRHFLERGSERYDVIQLSGVDTFSTTEAGAFTLSENYLYTVEAFRTYFDRLRPDGIVTLTRWFVPSFRTQADGRERFYPRYDLRLLALAFESLRQAGVQDPGASIFYLRCGLFTVILVKPAGFTRAEVDRLHEHCRHYRFDVLHSPLVTAGDVIVDGKPWPNVYTQFVATPDKRAFIDAYPFDISPPTDDRPFYFEVSRFRHIGERDHYLNSLGGMTAHGILTVLLLEVLLLGLVFVVLPLRRLRSARGRAARPPAQRLGTLLYFSSLGLGFILVEIVLSQKFILFLGHPFYSLAVILFSLLLFSGIGAALSSRFPYPTLAPLLPAVLAVLAGFGLGPVFDAFLHHELPVRIAIAVVALAPIGVALGVPFPTGIRALNANAPDLIPWAWGINGYTSVLGSVLAILLAIPLGFSRVLVLAALCYALGVLGLVLIQGRRPEEPTIAELAGRTP